MKNVKTKTSNKLKSQIFLFCRIVDCSFFYIFDLSILSLICIIKFSEWSNSIHTSEASILHTSHAVVLYFCERCTWQHVLRKHNIKNNTSRQFSFRYFSATPTHPVHPAHTSIASKFSCRCHFNHPHPHPFFCTMRRDVNFCKIGGLEKINK